MQHTAVVRRGQRGAQLACEIGGSVFGKTAEAAQRRGEIFAVDVLHGEKQMAVDFADVVHAADVRMGDLARRADFVVELREADGIVLEAVWQELQGDRLAEPQIVGAVHLAHAALAEHRDDDSDRRESPGPSWPCEIKPTGQPPLEGMADPAAAVMSSSGPEGTDAHYRLAGRHHEGTKITKHAHEDASWLTGV
jgi:hypothetical protein